MLKMSRDYIITRERARLVEFIEEGLNPVYDDFGDFLYDFYPDFAWDDSMPSQLQWLLDDEEWMALAAKVLETRGFNFVAEVRDAIANPEG